MEYINGGDLMYQIQQVGKFKEPHAVWVHTPTQQYILCDGINIDFQQYFGLIWQNILKDV